MRAKTAEGRHLKRLAKRYANAAVDRALEANDPRGQWGWDTRGALEDAKKKLHDEIDRITSVDLTPEPSQETTDAPRGE
jgi:hypothetical protein